MPVLCPASHAYFTPWVWTNVFILENSMRADNVAFLYHNHLVSTPLT